MDPVTQRLVATSPRPRASSLASISSPLAYLPPSPARSRSRSRSDSVSTSRSQPSERPVVLQPPLPSPQVSPQRSLVHKKSTPMLSSAGMGTVPPPPLLNQRRTDPLPSRRPTMGERRPSQLEIPPVDTIRMERDSVDDASQYYRPNRPNEELSFLPRPPPPIPTALPPLPSLSEHPPNRTSTSTSTSSLESRWTTTSAATTRRNKLVMDPMSPTGITVVYVDDLEGASLQTGSSEGGSEDGKKKKRSKTDRVMSFLWSSETKALIATGKTEAWVAALLSLNPSSAPVQRAFNPYSENGGTILAIASTDFAIVASDTRQSEGYSIQTRYARKCFQLTDEVVMAVQGFQADGTALVKRVKQRLEWYYHTHQSVPSLASIARMIQTMLYGKRFFPYYAYVILGGIDRDGTGAVYSFDPVGSYERESCRAAGAAQSLVQPFLDNMVYSKNQVPDPAAPVLAAGERPIVPYEVVLGLVTDAFTGATERHIEVGDGLEIFTIKKGHGVSITHLPLKRD